MRKIIAVVSCVLCTLGACALWNYAEILANKLDTNEQFFDFAAIILLFTALCCSCIYNDERKK